MTSLKPGDELTVPAVQEPKALYANRLEINMKEKIIRAFGGDAVVALFHCSIAKDAGKRPTGTSRITGVTTNPAYSFDPKMWPEVKDVKQKLLIPPGPRNPVGLCWMALSLPGYGIHGTPNPEMIGKTGSHGCFRMTNWDALRLGKMVAAGTLVQFVHTRSDLRVAASD
jgi:lipoprotein-anchoring transpeptidase ErfK/SrfK